MESFKPQISNKPESKKDKLKSSIKKAALLMAALSASLISHKKDHIPDTFKDNQSIDNIQSDTTINKPEISSDTVMFKNIDSGNKEIDMDTAHESELISAEYVQNLKNNLVDFSAKAVLLNKDWRYAGLDHAILAFGDKPVIDGLTIQQYIDKNSDTIFHDSFNKLGAEGSGHTAGFPYALIRSGIYDKMKSDGGEQSILADKIISSIKQSDYASLGKYDYEFIFSTWIELKKRGIDTVDIYPYVFDPEDTIPDNVNGKAFTPEELYNLNEGEVGFKKDPTKIKKYEKKIDDSLNLSKYHMGFGMSGAGIKPTCEATHALNSLVMYDVYTKNNDKLKEHLNYDIDTVLRNAIDSKILDSTSTDQLGEKLHNLAHGLMPITELPEDYVLDSKQKETVLQALHMMCQYSEEYIQKIDINKERHILMETSHVIDILNHLPKNLQR